jgi:hypothetical protein
MTERGLPTSDGAPACPFVAFEDDRDERASSPDHRHRCFAEPNPAPRALAHQEAYCLSSAFPVCPTFQDWARREAARSRVSPAGESDSTLSPAAAEQSQRNPPRNWQAPPPWMGGTAGPSAGDEFDDRWEHDEAIPPPPPPRATEPDVEHAAPDEPDDDADELPPNGRGLSGSYADRVAAGGAAASAGGEPPDDPDELTPAAHPSREADSAWRASAAAAAAQPVRPRRERDPDRMAGFTESQSSPPPQPSAPGRPRRRDPGAPEWERARPSEVFPTLRARRLPELSIPPILVSVVALALAAAVLFALPGLLGFGAPGGAVATPSRGTSTDPTPQASLAPTQKPEPTQQTYVVKSGDTMSRIAKKYGVPLDELIAANADNIPNPDSLDVGDVVIIPAGDSGELPGAT